MTQDMLDVILTLDPHWKVLFVKKLTLACSSNPKTIKAVMKASQNLNVLRFRKVMEHCFARTPDQKMVAIMNTIIHTSLNTEKDCEIIRKVLQGVEMALEEPPKIPDGVDKSGNFVFN